MGDIFASIRHGFAGLLRFSGRDTRQQFWPYAICIAFSSWVISYMVMIPQMLRMFQGIAQVAAERPDPNMTPEQINAMVIGLMPDLGFILLVSLIINLLAALLLAAATARRLHDCDWTGLWGLLPLPFLLAGYLFAPRGYGKLGRIEDAELLRLTIPGTLSSLLMWGLLIFLIVLMAREGTPGPNRFGPPPAQP